MFEGGNNGVVVAVVSHSPSEAQGISQEQEEG